MDKSEIQKPPAPPEPNRRKNLKLLGGAMGAAVIGTVALPSETYAQESSKKPRKELPNPPLFDNLGPPPETTKTKDPAAIETGVRVSMRGLPFPNQKDAAECVANITTSVGPFAQMLGTGLNVELYTGRTISGVAQASALMVFCPQNAISEHLNDITAAALNAGVKDFDSRLDSFSANLLVDKYREVYKVTLGNNYEVDKRLKNFFRVPEYTDASIVSTGDDMSGRQDYLANSFTIVANYFPALKQKLEDPKLDPSLKEEVTNVILACFAAIEDTNKMNNPEPFTINTMGISDEKVVYLQKYGKNKIRLAA